MVWNSSSPKGYFEEVVARACCEGSSRFGSFYQQVLRHSSSPGDVHVPLREGPCYLVVCRFRNPRSGHQNHLDGDVAGGSDADANSGSTPSWFSWVGLQWGGPATLRVLVNFVGPFVQTKSVWWMIFGLALQACAAQGRW